MTAPAEVGVVSEINASISAIQARIAALAPTSTSSTSSAAFNNVLSSVRGSGASATTGTTATAPPTTAVTPAPSSSSSSSSSTVSGGTSGSAVVADAEKYLGVPYVWGGETRSGGMDCSGLVQTTFHDLGIKLPRTAAEQSHCGTPVNGLANAKPGDLLFFGNPAYHVAIYAGNGQLIESPQPGQTVHKTSVYQTPTSIRRIVTAAPATSAVTSSAGGLSASQLTSAGLSSAVASYAGQFAAAEAKYHLPAGMLAAVAQQESGGNSRAVSPAGAEGLMQLMPSTAASYGVDPLNPSQAIDAAGRILGESMRRYDGSVSLSLAAYNAGAGAVARYGGIPPYPETQNYVKRITAMMAAGG